MEREQFEELVSLELDGALTASQHAELEEVCRRNIVLDRMRAQDHKLARLMRTIEPQHAPVSLAARVMGRLEAEMAPASPPPIPVAAKAPAPVQRAAAVEAHAPADSEGATMLFRPDPVIRQAIRSPRSHTTQPTEQVPWWSALFGSTALRWGFGLAMLGVIIYMGNAALKTGHPTPNRPIKVSNNNPPAVVATSSVASDRTAADPTPNTETMIATRDRNVPKSKPVQEPPKAVTSVATDPPATPSAEPESAPREMVEDTTKPAVAPDMDDFKTMRNSAEEANRNPVEPATEEVTPAETEQQVDTPEPEVTPEPTVEISPEEDTTPTPLPIIDATPRVHLNDSPKVEAVKPRATESEKEIQEPDTAIAGASDGVKKKTFTDVDEWKRELERQGSRGEKTGENTVASAPAAQTLPRSRASERYADAPAEKRVSDAEELRRNLERNEAARQAARAPAVKDRDYRDPASRPIRIERDPNAPGSKPAVRVGEEPRREVAGAKAPQTVAKAPQSPQPGTSTKTIRITPSARDPYDTRVPSTTSLRAPGATAAPAPDRTSAKSLEIGIARRGGTILSRAADTKNPGYQRLRFQMKDSEFVKFSSEMEGQGVRRMSSSNAHINGSSYYVIPNPTQKAIAIAPGEKARAVEVVVLLKDR